MGLSVDVDDGIVNAIHEEYLMKEVEGKAKRKQKTRGQCKKKNAGAKGEKHVAQ